MPRRPVNDDDLVERFRLQPRGVATWMTRDEIERSRRRWRRVSVFFVLLALFWVLSLFGEEIDGELILGFVALELFTAMPLAYSALRLRQLRRFGRAAEVPSQAQLDDIEQEQVIDESLHRITGLVDRLPTETRRMHGDEALHAARRTAAEWRKLLRRSRDLQVLQHSAASDDGRASLRERIERTEGDITQLRLDMDRLAVTLADLADATDDHDLAQVTARVQAAEERMLLFVDALEELRAADGTQD